MTARTRGLLATMAALYLVAAIVPAAGLAANTRYHVDCLSGSDERTGLAEGEAWGTLAKASALAFEPGDAILLRRGTRCDGVLAPHGSGIPGAPITIGAYGDGPPPQIAGGGARAAILLRDVEGWEVRDIDVSNLGPDPQPGEKRTAIAIQYRAGGVGRHYVVENVHVHDVNNAHLPPQDSTDYENYTKDTGGIIFGGAFDNVLIDSNTLERVDREGIFINGVGSPTTGLVIRRNTLREIGGDGIVTVGSTGALVERNHVDGFNTKGLIFNAGIWGFNTTGAVFQFNDVAHGQHGPLDSQAYDIDGGNVNMTFQYNLSRENSGGFLMVCNNLAPLSPGARNENNVVRYNISQNDYAVGRGVIDAPFACASTRRIDIYNNTVYTRDPRVSSLVENTAGSDLRLTNNILVGPSPQALIVDQVGTWSNNLYLGVTCAPRPADPHPVVADPRFLAAGKATSLADSGGYALRTGSPALAAGVPVPDDGGRDYFGNPIPATGKPNIGAYQGRGVSAPSGLLDVPLPAVAPGC